MKKFGFYLKILINLFIVLLLLLSLVLLIFGFGEEGFKILKVSEFWLVVDSLWILAILLLLLKIYYNK